MKKIVHYCISSILCLFMVSAFFPAAVHADGITTGADLLAAINNAEPGDTITLAAGTITLPNFTDDGTYGKQNQTAEAISYHQYNEIPGISITKSITIKGADNHATVLDGEICIYAADVTIEGLTIQRSSVVAGYENTPVIQFFKAKNVDIKDNIVYGTNYSNGSATGRGYAIGSFWGGDMVSGKIENNTVYGGVMPGQVYSDGNEELSVTGNKIMASRKFAFVFSFQMTAGRITVANNEVVAYNEWQTPDTPAIQFSCTTAAQRPATVNGITVDGTLDSDMKIKASVAAQNGLTVDQVKIAWPTELKAAASVTDTSGGISYYSTLADAVAAAQSGDTVTMLSDLSENITIAQNQSIALDLNSHTLTGTAAPASPNSGITELDKAAIVNHGTLTIKDTGGNGVITNTQNQCDTFYNDGTAVLNGGKYTHALGSDGWYAIHNHGTMTINDGVTADYTGDYGSSPVMNGWSRHDPDYVSGDAKMTINGGTFIDGSHTVKNGDSHASLTINGGTFKNSSGTQSAGGINLIDSRGTCTAEITGGGFAGTITSATAANLKISGGYYNNEDPKSYLADTYVLQSSDKQGYTYMVVKASSTVVVQKGDTTAQPINAPEGKAEMTQTAKDTLTESAASAVLGSDNATSNSLKAAADKADKPDFTEAQNILENYNVDTAGKNLDIVIKTRLDITPEYYDTVNNEITVDIQPMYDVYVTTASDTGTPEESNMKKVGESHKLTIPDGTPVKITIEIPADIAEQQPLMIKHIKQDGTVYYYEASVSQLNGKNYADFIITHGFSQVIIKAKNTHTVTVSYDTDLNNPVTYRVTDVSSALKTGAEKSGYQFAGWKISGQSGVYKILSDDLFNTLTAEGNAEVTATAQYTSLPKSGSSGKNQSFLVTFLDSKGNTVKIEWVESGKDATPPEGYGTYTGYRNVTSHRDLYPNTGYKAPNTADRS